MKSYWNSSSNLAFNIQEIHPFISSKQSNLYKSSKIFYNIATQNLMVIAKEYSIEHNLQCYKITFIGINNINNHEN